MLTVPVAVNDYFETLQDAAVAIPAASLLADDSDALQVAPVIGQGPYEGTLTFDKGGDLLYTPSAGYYGHDEFRYFAFDGNAFSKSFATVSIEVKQGTSPGLGTIVYGIVPLPFQCSIGWNENPLVPAAVGDCYTTPEDTPLTIAAPGVLGNDFNGDRTTLTATVESEPAHGQVSLNADGSFTYLSSQDYFGQDEFVYSLTNNGEFVGYGHVVLNVTPVNDAPVPHDDAYTTESGLPLTIKSYDLDTNDRDVENDRLTLVMLLTKLPEHGSLALQNPGLVYTPVLGYQGSDGFAYYATDGQDFSATTANVSIEMTVPVRHNARLATDVNNDARLSPVDVLLIINCLNGIGTGPVARAANYGRELLDVNGDGMVAPVDALLVINALNSHPSGSEGENAEGEAVGNPEANQFGSTAEMESFDLLSTLALDSAAAAKRRRF